MRVFGQELWHSWAAVRRGPGSIVAGPDVLQTCAHCGKKRTLILFGDIAVDGWPNRSMDAER